MSAAHGVRFGKYAFLRARLGALKAELLTPEQWGRLLACPSWEQQRHVLESTSYASSVDRTPEDTLRNVRKGVYATARKIERSVPPEAARLIHQWGRRDLLRNVRTILRGKALGRSEDEIRSALLELAPTHRIATDRLLGAANLDEAFDLLEETAVRRWIRAARRVYEKDPTLFGLDAALDRLYYSEVARHASRLDSADRATVEEILSWELDQVNLLWLLRYRLNYRLSPPETYYLLLPVTGRLTSEQLKVLVREDSLDRILGGIRVAALRELLRDVESIWQVEVAIWRYRARRARGMVTRAGFTAGGAMALLLLKVVESRNLVALMEGRRVGLGLSDIREQLVEVGDA